MTKDSSLFDKLNSILNEEVYIRSDLSSIPVTKFKIYDDLIDDYILQDKVFDIKDFLEQYLQEHNSSIAARYILGILKLDTEKELDKQKFLYLLDGFKDVSKWVIIEHIANKILNFDNENIFALVYKSEVLEKQKRNEELKLVLKVLAEKDRKNPLYLKKYGLSIIDINKNEGLNYIKQAIVLYLNLKQYEDFESIWDRIYRNLDCLDDLSYIEKIEKIILRNRDRDKLATYFYPLLDSYKAQSDWDSVIYISKKILQYQPDSNRARTEIIRAYNSKYTDHSLLSEFLKFSEIGNSKKAPLQCIQNFERNIVFDINNYVSHRSWGVGKVVNISSDEDSICVDFSDKKDHKFSIKMAIKSLKPLKKDHILVLIHEDRDLIKDRFLSNPIEVVEMYVKSFNNSILVSDLKQEILATGFLNVKDWTRLWAKITASIKKHHNIVFNPKKKDEINYREKKITFAEEQEEKFFALSDADSDKKLEVTLKVLENPEFNENILNDDYLEKLEVFNNYYRSMLDNNREIPSLFGDSKLLSLEQIKQIANLIYCYIYFTLCNNLYEKYELKSYIYTNLEESLLKKIFLEYFTIRENSLELLKLISVGEIKKKLLDIVFDLLKEEKYAPIIGSFIFDKSVKINKNAFNLLVKNGEYEDLKLVLKQVIQSFKEFPDVFLIIASLLLTDKESTKSKKTPSDKEYTIANFQKFLDSNPAEKLTKSDLMLNVFRIMKTVSKIEIKGTKLKNLISTIINFENSVLIDIIKNSDEQYIRKIYALYKEISYISDIEKKNFYNFISQILDGEHWWSFDLYQEFETTKQKKSKVETIITTQKSFDKRKEELSYLINVEMPANSKDIGEAQEKGDLRENSEYKAAMEKQAQLQLQITNLETDLKRVEILDISKVDTTSVNIGCVVKLKNLGNEQIISYSILGIWDADTKNNLISYESPLAKALMGKKVDETINLSFLNQSSSDYQILEISLYQE